MTARMLALGLWFFGTAVAFGQVPDGTAPAISVRGSENGSYTVAAYFSVPEPARAVRAVLTDYEQIPRFMPDLRMSRVLERAEGRARIEQEAVSRFMLFSKRVHLVLDVEEREEVIRFRDRCGKSFKSYEGVWMITEHVGRTDIEYRLTATPAFDVPGFVLRRLLDRDARTMIDGLRAAIGTRALAR